MRILDRQYIAREVAGPSDPQDTSASLKKLDPGLFLGSVLSIGINKAATILHSETYLRS